MKSFSAPMVLSVLMVLVSAFVLLSWSQGLACEKQDPLFKIERNKNGNVVHYDACLLGNGSLSASNPVEVYWMMENGTKEGLNKIEEKFGYGIDSIKRLGKDELQVAIKALKGRDIIIKKLNGEYQALIRIGGKLSVLDKVYVQAKESAIGLPKVAYADLYGRNPQTNQPVQERITPQ